MKKLWTFLVTIPFVLGIAHAQVKISALPPAMAQTGNEILPEYQSGQCLTTQGTCGVTTTQIQQFIEGLSNVWTGQNTFSGSVLLGSPTGGALGSGTLNVATGLYVNDVIVPTYPRTAAEIAAGVTPVAYNYPPGNVLRYGADPTGTIDSTTAIHNDMIANAGAIVDFGNGNTYLVSASLTMYSGTLYKGNSIVRQKNGSNITGSDGAAILTGTTITDVVVDGLQIDGNAANNTTGETHGIEFLDGSDNTVKNVYVHDTTGACVYFNGESGGQAVNDYLVNCGRSGFTDNHGLMVVSVSSSYPLTSFKAIGNTVVSAYRKGITTYSDTPGYVRGIVIAGNAVTASGLGGIYCANAVSTIAQADISITGNHLYDNYVNIEFDNQTGGSVTGNTGDSTSGGPGISSTDSVYSVIADNSLTNSQAAGINIVASAITPKGLTVAGNTIALSSQSGAGSYSGIYLSGVQYSDVTGNTILGEATSPKQNYGIDEVSGSNYNLYATNNIANTYVGSFAYVGANDSIAFQVGVFFAADKFTATAGQTTFTLSAVPATANQTLVILNGSVLTPGDDYTISGTTLTLVNAASAGQRLVARY